MAEFNIRNISKWLEVTPQQFEILESIYRLQQAGKQASPKAIIEEDARIRGGPTIQKSNLFMQLKILRERGFVKQASKANYAIDFRGVQKKLAKTEKVINAEVEEFRKACRETEEYFRELSAGDETPMVRFMPYDAACDKIADLLKTSDKCFITGIFPRIVYANSSALLNLPLSKRYGEVLWERCIREKSLELTYLARFDMAYIFDRLSRAYGDVHMAYEECKNILSTLEYLAKTQKNLHFYFIDSPYILDMVIPHDGHDNEVFIMVRDENLQGIGAIYLRSTDLAIKFKRIYLEEIKRAVSLSSPEGRGVVAKLRKRLEDVYKKSCAGNKAASETKEGEDNRGKETQLV